MTRRSRRSEQRHNEDLRAAYPDAWIRGEHLANNQFRDFIYVGLGQGGKSREFVELAQACLPAAVERWLHMSGQTRSSVDGWEVQAFSRAFSSRLVYLFSEYARMPAEDAPQRSLVGVVATMKPGSVYALVQEGENARLNDDMRGGPLTALLMQKDFAIRSLYAKGATDEMSLAQLARIDQEAVAKILEGDIFTGRETLTEDLYEVVGPANAQRLWSAHQAREKRLQGSN